MCIEQDSSVTSGLLSTDAPGSDCNKSTSEATLGNVMMGTDEEDSARYLGLLADKSGAAHSSPRMEAWVILGKKASISIEHQADVAEVTSHGFWMQEGWVSTSQEC